MTSDKKSSKKEELEKLEKIQSLQEMIANAEQTIMSAKHMLSEIQGSENGKNKTINSPDGQIIHGDFDGQIMIGEDGKQYPVPANYASKSKLVEGDKLKLTITPEGNFMYKQIGPIDRKYLIGLVQKDERGNFVVKTEEKKYKVLLAAATYFKIELGDEVTVIVPRDKNTTWSAIENVIKKATDFSSFMSVGAVKKDSPGDDKLDNKEELPHKPSAIEKLEKEMEEEREKGQNTNSSILDEWTPDITDEIKKEVKK